MKILFIGLGSAGTRHYKLINEHFGHDCYSFSALGRDFGEVDKIKPDVAFICCPTHLHINYALDCAERGMALFIEKPIDCATLGLRQLLDICEKKNLTTYVAYNLRHHRDVGYLKKRVNIDKLQYSKLSCRTNLANWRPYDTYSAHEHQGGGAILELSHEIDLAEYLFGKIVLIDGYFTRLGHAPTDAEDYASLNVTHENGHKTEIILDIGSKLERRKIEIRTNDFKCEYDLKADTNAFKKMWWLQLGYFFDNIGNPRMMNNLFDASVLFRKIVKFKERYKDNYFFDR